MFWEWADLFTLFVLGVSVVLSFILRRLIAQIQELKEEIAKELNHLTEALVVHNPSLENYFQLALFFFRTEDYAKARQYFDHVLASPIYTKEASYYLTLCLLRLGFYNEAGAMSQKLEPSLYSREEWMQLQKAFQRPSILGQGLEKLIRFLLTRVSLQYTLVQAPRLGDKDFQIRQILANLPARYSDLSLLAQSADSFDFDGFDQHLNRRVLLRAARLDKIADEEDFLEYPRLLAPLQSRHLPRVYDLQMGSNPFYCLEPAEGKDLYSVLQELPLVQDGLRLYLKLIEILIDLRSKNAIFIGLQPQNSGVLLRDGQLFLLARIKPLTMSEEARFQENLIQSLHVYLSSRLAVLPVFGESLLGVQAQLGEILADLIGQQGSAMQEFLDQLSWLEMIHRASIHGLKGKMSIAVRYKEDKIKLLATFFRHSNITDIQDKLRRLKGFIREFPSDIRPQIPVCEELLKMNFDLIESRLEASFEAYKRGESEAGLDFLHEYHLLFEHLSDHLAQTIELHSLSLEPMLRAFWQGYLEKERVRLSRSREFSIIKIRVRSRQKFEENMGIVLENLLNNSFEAGASQVEMRLLEESPDCIRLEIQDNGPGFGSKEITGGTGLTTSRALCESMGVNFSIPKTEQGALIRLMIPVYRA